MLVIKSEPKLVAKKNPNLTLMSKRKKKLVGW